MLTLTNQMGCSYTFDKTCCSVTNQGQKAILQHKLTKATTIVYL